MRVKKHCNCPTDKLTKESYDSLLMEALISANKLGKDRVIVKRSNTLTHVALSANEMLELEEFAIIRAGKKSILDVEHIQRPI